MDGSAIDTVQTHQDADLYKLGFDIEQFRRAYRCFWARRGMEVPQDEFNRATVKYGEEKTRPLPQNATTERERVALNLLRFW